MLRKPYIQKNNLLFRVKACNISVDDTEGREFKEKLTKCDIGGRGKEMLFSK